MPRWRAPRPAGLPGSPPARERRQLVVRAPAGRRGGSRRRTAGLTAARTSTTAGAAVAAQLFGAARANSTGADLACLAHARAVRRGAGAACTSAACRQRPRPTSTPRWHAWRMASPPGTARARWRERAALLRRAADALDARLPEFCALLVKEAHKTLGDCVAEVREAVDFLRYYADQADSDMAPQGCTAWASSSASARGISRWRSLPARWRRRWWPATRWQPSRPSRRRSWLRRMVALLHEAGVPHDALALLHGPRRDRRRGLVADARTAGVCFTGSTQVAHTINRALAAKDGAGRAADRRDRRPERDDRRLDRAARAGRRCRRAERLPLGRPALLGAAPAAACTRASPTA